MGTNLFFLKISPEEPDSAIDVKAYSSRRYHTVIKAGCAYPADGKTVSPVNIRHRQRRAYYSRKMRNICYLLRGLILPYHFNIVLIYVDQARHPHTGFIRLRDSPLKLIHSLKRACPSIAHESDTP
jgi:hypothetical protein